MSKEIEEFIEKTREERIIEINEKMETCLDDLGYLNDFLNKEYITLAEFDIIKNRILDKMINLSRDEKAVMKEKLF